MVLLQKGKDKVSLTRVVHHFIPALLLPGAIPSVFPGLKVFVSYNQENIIVYSATQCTELVAFLCEA